MGKGGHHRESEAPPIGGSGGFGPASIRTRLGLAFALFLLLLGSSGLFSLRQIGMIGDAARDLHDVALPRVLAVNDISSALTTHSLLAKRRVQTTDFRQVASMAATMRTAEEAFDSKLGLLKADLSGGTDISLIADIETQWQSYLDSFSSVLELTEQGSLRRAQSKLDGETRELVETLFRSLEQLVAATRGETDRMAMAVTAEHARARRLTLAVLATGLAATALAIAWTSRSVSQPLLRISAAMRQLTRGLDETRIPDLSGRRDEIGVLAQAAEAFRDTMMETRQLAADLDQERDRLSSTVRNMPLGLCMFDSAAELVIWNRAFEKIWHCPAGLLREGSPKTSVLGAIAELNMAGEAQTFADTILGMIDAGKPAASIVRLPDGRSVSVMLEPTPGGWMMICEDVTDRVDAEDRIRRLARHDPLTGLPNRLCFRETIESALEAASPDLPVAIMFIDLDRFKHVNDTLGHPVGDGLLRQVANRLTWAAGEGDVVARLGGDEFAVINRGRSQPADALALGDRIIEQLVSPFDIDGHHVQIGGSVGIAVAPLQGDTADEIQRNADLALYAVKEAGKGHCRVFDPSMNDRQQALHELEQALRAALEADAFTVAYQPLCDLATGHICGAEALLRWHHPLRGEMPPAEFIPLAEELRLIRPIGAKVLGMACRAAAEWPGDIKVSVNLSPQQIHDGDIAAEVMAAIAESGLDPHRLELEITEGVLLQDTGKTLSSLHALRDHGISIALDDFGTGYSSLRYLRAFPFDRVKIDAAFVRGLPSDTSAATIIEAICTLCSSFGIAVTAEGIETPDQLEFVRDAGCMIGQGFHFARPMPDTDFREFLRQSTGPVGGDDWRQRA
ncbi:EAL domain-containing protein [Mangrovicoccus ximenensis]|uniref:EAL domain-containing protein n=1 Tax=Mangrovicoccus ximenensis TaxID=1911570 RepID=UPI000D35D3DA|nr:EAL domain-containing protein [Mangrovicoccus ximenensis]